MTSKIKFILPIFLIALDQASKILAVKYFSKQVVFNKLGGFDIEVGQLNYLIVSLLALLVITLIIRLVGRQYLKHWGFLLILSGGVSNIIDRVILGGVVDFFSSSFWPTFNLADTFITVGAVWLFFDLLAVNRTRN